MKFSKLTKPELEVIIENANFTEQEEEIFSLLARGFYTKRNINENLYSAKNSRKAYL